MFFTRNPKFKETYIGFRDYLQKGIHLSSCDDSDPDLVEIQRRKQIEWPNDQPGRDALIATFLNQFPGAHPEGAPNVEDGIEGPGVGLDEVHHAADPNPPQEPQPPAVVGNADNLMQERQDDDIEHPPSAVLLEQRILHPAPSADERSLPEDGNDGAEFGAPSGEPDAILSLATAPQVNTNTGTAIMPPELSPLPEGMVDLQAMGWDTLNLLK